MRLDEYVYFCVKNIRISLCRSTVWNYYSNNMGSGLVLDKKLI